MRILFISSRLALDGTHGIKMLHHLLHYLQCSSHCTSNVIRLRYIIRRYNNEPSVCIRSCTCSVVIRW